MHWLRSNSVKDFSLKILKLWNFNELLYVGPFYPNNPVYSFCPKNPEWAGFLKNPGRDWILHPTSFYTGYFIYWVLTSFSAHQLNLCLLYRYPGEILNYSDSVCLEFGWAKTFSGYLMMMLNSKDYRNYRYH